MEIDAIISYPNSSHHTVTDYVPIEKTGGLTSLLHGKFVLHQVKFQLIKKCLDIMEPLSSQNSLWTPS
jgi:hypothetical protein